MKGPRWCIRIQRLQSTCHKYVQKLCFQNKGKYKYNASSNRVSRKTFKLLQIQNGNSVVENYNDQMEHLWEKSNNYFQQEEKKKGQIWRKISRNYKELIGERLKKK